MLRPRRHDLVGGRFRDPHQHDGLLPLVRPLRAHRFVELLRRRGPRPTGAARADSPRDGPRLPPRLGRVDARAQPLERLGRRRVRAEGFRGAQRAPSRYRLRAPAPLQLLRCALDRIDGRLGLSVHARASPSNPTALRADGPWPCIVPRPAISAAGDGLRAHPARCPRRPRRGPRRYRAAAPTAFGVARARRGRPASPPAVRAPRRRAARRCRSGPRCRRRPCRIPPRAWRGPPWSRK